MWKRVVTVIMQVLVEIDTVQGTFLLHKATFLYYKELIGASLSCTIPTMGTRLVLQIQDKWRWSSQRYVLLQGIPESIDFLFFHAAWINAEAPVGWHIV